MVAIDFTGLARAAGALTLPVARIQTASIGIPDTFFLMLLALVVFGPRRLPEIGRQIGKLMYEFRKVSNDFKFQMEEELRSSEEAERLRKLQAAVSAPTPPELPAPAELSALAESAPDIAPAVDGEVRAETPKLPQILPPSTGDPIAAQKPFRSRYADPAPNPDPEPHSEPDPEPASGPNPEPAQAPFAEHVTQNAGEPTPATGNSEFSARVTAAREAAAEQEVQHG